MSSENLCSSCGIDNLSIICAMALDRAIGKNGKMPWHIKEELQHFKKVTMGKPMIMGRVTFESLGCKSLPGRQSIILTRSDMDVPANCHIAHNEEQALQVAAQFMDESKEVMVIGGAKVYELFLPLANKLYLSQVNKKVDGDAFFPKIDAKQYKLINQKEYAEFTAYEYMR